jgi:hypothetical protein
VVQSHAGRRAGTRDGAIRATFTPAHDARARRAHRHRTRTPRLTAHHRHAGHFCFGQRKTVAQDAGMLHTRMREYSFHSWDCTRYRPMIGAYARRHCRKYSLTAKYKLHSSTLTVDGAANVRKVGRKMAILPVWCLTHRVNLLAVVGMLQMPLVKVSVHIRALLICSRSIPSTRRRLSMRTCSPFSRTFRRSRSHNRCWYVACAGHR